MLSPLSFLSDTTTQSLLVKIDHTSLEKKLKNNANDVLHSLSLMFPTNVMRTSFQIFE